MPSKELIRYSIGIPKKTYQEIKAMADERGIPKSRVINAILNGYFRSKRERENK